MNRKKEKIEKNQDNPYAFFKIQKELLHSVVAVQTKFQDLTIPSEIEYDYTLFARTILHNTLYLSYVECQNEDGSYTNSRIYTSGRADKKVRNSRELCAKFSVEFDPEHGALKLKKIKANPLLENGDDLFISQIGESYHIEKDLENRPDTQKLVKRIMKTLQSEKKSQTFIGFMENHHL